MIIDATDLIAGRIATVAAKRALMGEKVDIVNAEKAIISGSRDDVFAKFKRRRAFGAPLTGPYNPRMPDRLMRRIARGMLRHRVGRGREAYARIMCYIGVPLQFKDQKIETIEKAHKSSLPNTKYVTLKEICRFLGATL
ncbi:MAG TPA: 50S ribosomal protein L13 [Candidatus Nanoarchaeia archaeon]|nr:50S ribosomal protein L13 [Candidatus Nanoarchaeia archaeon]